MRRLIRLISVIFFAACGIASAQTTNFTYQGKLNDGGFAATAQYDFTFKLYDSVSGGTQIGADVVRDDAHVTAGIFTVNLNFGASSFATGAARFLEIAVRQGASTGAFTTLAPRQPLTSAPFSIKTLSATVADELSNACNPCITDAQIIAIDGAKVTGIVNNAINAGTAMNISGVVPITNGGTGSTTKNYVDLTTDQTVAGNKTFSGTLSGNGSGLTNVNATVANGSITTAKLADASVTAAKLAPDAIAAPVSNLTLLGSLRWDLLRGQKDFAAGTNPRGAAFDGANMWVAIAGGASVVKLRVSDGANLGTFPVGSLPISLAFDGANIWIVNLISVGRVVKVRTSDGANIGSFPVGTSPSEIAFDGTNIWVSNGGSSNITKLRTADGVNLGTFPFDGANMWVSNGGNATRLSPAFP